MLVPFLLITGVHDHRPHVDVKLLLREGRVLRNLTLCGPRLTNVERLQKVPDLVRRLRRQLISHTMNDDNSDLLQLVGFHIRFTRKLQVELCDASIDQMQFLFMANAPRTCL